MLICNKCGKTGKRGKFCVYCGGELSEFFTIKTVESDAEPTAECPECGKKFADGKFCVFCGTALKPIGGAVIDDAPAVQEMSEPVVETPAAEVPEAGGQLVCVECGKIHERGKFCTSCGGALKPVGEAAEAAAPIVEEAPAAVIPAETPAPPAEVPADGGKLVCVECGKIHERGKFCTSCGGALRAVGTVEGSPVPIVEEAPVIETPVAEATAADNSKLICPACGKIHERGKFCTVCGTGLQPMGAAPQPEIAAQPEPVQQMPVQPAVQTTDGKLVCTECGKVHERGKFCTACGGNLVPAGAPSEQPAPVTAPFMAPPIPAPIPSAPTASPTSGLVCPSCGKTFERGKFCTVCGTTLVAQSDQTSTPVNDGMMHCTQCGKTFPSGKFCTVCGGKLVTSDMLNV
ncbi:MAG: hypothetical protein E7493_06980 [Ruminococcus albus]|nr:hypothetical protein [Ruminococcus albus]